MNTEKPDDDPTLIISIQIEPEKEKIYSLQVLLNTESFELVKRFKEVKQDCSHWYNPFLVCFWCGYDAVASKDHDAALERRKHQGDFKFSE